MNQEHHEQLKNKATIAYKNKLFVKNNNYMLRGYLQAIRYSKHDMPPRTQVPNMPIDYWEDLMITLEYRDGEAVGVALIDKNNQELIAIYVKQAYRRQGIARKLCEGQEITTCNEGTREGSRFFTSMGYEVKPT
jgi:GNAT superfamily N-acetyltransferase